MPKQFYKIVQFHGGLNSSSDARDIAENELSEATDIMVDELGKIRLINPGYGLFQFSHDRIDGHTAGSGVETGADYMVFSEPDTAGTVDIYSNEDDDFQSPITGMANNDSGLRADVFYIVDGVLRVCDGNFANSNTNKWYGYIKRTHFDGQSPGGSADDYDTWSSKNQIISAPTRGLYSRTLDSTDAGTASTTVFNATDGEEFADMDTELDKGDYIAVNIDSSQARIITSCTDDDTIVTEPLSGINWDGDEMVIAPSAGTGFNIGLAVQNTAGSGWTHGNYEIGTTFIYDGNQESLIFNNVGTSDVAITITDAVLLSVVATSPYDPRITGGRVYFREYGSTKSWYLLAEISMKEGVKGGHDGVYTPWYINGPEASYDLTAVGSGDAGTNVYLANSNGVHSALWIYSPPSVETYETINGWAQDEYTLEARYKTAVVANRIVYIGNIKTKDKDGEDIIKGDAIIKSPVNKFDTFPSSRVLETSIRDGDSIVKLEVYADRLLIFKKNKLELLNISQEIEFLEDTFMYKGVSHPAATCKTDFGIAWVNKQGCYLYDGQKVNNLLEKQGRQIIKESDWATFTTNEPMIGYIPKKRQLLVVDDNSTTGTGKTFLYDLVTQSWVKGADATITSQALTNFVTDWNGDLVYAHTSDTGTFVKWDNASVSNTAVDIKTKDIDFGQPALTKRIYKFYVTHRGSASNIQLSYAKDGDQDTYTEAGSELPVTSAVTDWVTTAITPTTFSCNSVRLRLFSDGTTPANFEINDITIVYRLKGVR